MSIMKNDKVAPMQQERGGERIGKYNNKGEGQSDERV